jgi:hypothetical protein
MPQLFGRIKNKLISFALRRLTVFVDLQAKREAPGPLRPAHCALHSQNMAGDFMAPVGDCTVPVGDCTVPARDYLVPASVRKRKKQRSGNR